jgi:glucose/arabinose dehydrogenase
MKRWGIALGACVGLLAACTGSPKPQSSSSASTSSSVSVTPSPSFSITALRALPKTESLPRFTAVKITGANYPAGLAAAPDGRIFFSELYGGRIRVIRADGTLDPKPWFDVNAKFKIHWEQFFHGGLTGLAFDPEFKKNHFVYAVTQVPDAKTGIASKSLILRFVEKNGRGSVPTVLLTVPAAKFDNIYSLVFGPDGMLYVPSGQGRHRAKGADPLDDLLGKILRVTRDGKAPGDDPYGERAPLVWTTGIRNAFDIAFGSSAGYIVGGDNGTVGHDEINLYLPGRDYGYPGKQGFTSARGLTPPLLDFGSDAEGPVGIIYYTGSKYPQLRGRFLMCMNHGKGMVALRIAPSDPGRLLSLTPIMPDCTLDLIQMPDGSVVFSDAQTIYRLARA